MDAPVVNGYWPFFVLKIIKPWEVTDFSALETAERPINRGPEVKIVTSHGERT